MRTILQVTVDTQIGNEAITDGENGGRLAAVIEATLEELKPEAAYFFTSHDGKRHGIIVFDLDDQTRIPSIAEPLFQQLGAQVSFSPVMNAEDLQQGLQTLAGYQGAHADATVGGVRLPN